MFSTGAKVDGACSKSWCPKTGRRWPVDSSMKRWNSLRSAMGCGAVAWAGGFDGSGDRGGGWLGARYRTPG